ncbi:MAG: ribonuclease III [Firmicutes bacterium]|nr:ribonuclease III [Bacillota bacterium]
MHIKEKKDLSELEEIIGYKFKNIELLYTALTHSSFANEKDFDYSHNERLEFLGDSILNTIISLYLFQNKTDITEGQLTRMRANIVCEQSLFFAAKSINLGSYVFLSKGEESSGGRHRTSILADAIEALIAAIYLDGGFVKAEEFVLSILKNTIESSIKNKIFNDYKSFIQEYIQKNNLGLIKYKVLSETGPDHLKEFSIALFLNNKIVGVGKGYSKKDAQQLAAKNAIEVLRLKDE